MNIRKHDILQALQAWVRQRPGLEFGNYGNATAYRAELRGITRDRRHAETMINAIAWRDSIGADDILQGAKGAFSGRLTITEGADRRVSVDYCAGQYWPTEYRRAVCAVCSSILWSYAREHAGCATGDAIRKWARDEFGIAIARAWFR